MTDRIQYTEPDRIRTIVDPRGQPARKARDLACPQCGAGPEKRTASCGFGTPHPVCACGFEWNDEVWNG